MNGSLIIGEPEGAKDRAVHLLRALDFGLYPPDGSRDEVKAQADKDMDVVAKATAAVSAAGSDFAAYKETVGAVARLLGLKRYGVASGRFTPDRRPLPVFDAASQALGMSGLPVPAQSGPRLTTEQRYTAAVNAADLQTEIAQDEVNRSITAARARVMAGQDGGAK